MAALSLPASLPVGFSPAVLVGAAPRNGAQPSGCGGSRLWGLLLLPSMGSRARRLRSWDAGSGVVARGISCSTARGIFLDQRSNPSVLRRQADSLPLSHRGRPQCCVLRVLCIFWINSSLSGVSFANIFPKIVTCLLVLLTLFFTEYKFLILMMSYLAIL